MTLPYERVWAMKQHLDFTKKLLGMTLTEIRINARTIRDDAYRIRRHAPTEEMFTYYFKHREDKE